MGGDESPRVITIDYFSDLLCVWAYAGQVRLDALQREFGNEVLVRHRFLSLFADTATRIGEGWRAQGGFAGFGAHMQEVCAQWEHTRLDTRAWCDCRPASSTTAHVFLKALGLCLGLADGPAADAAARSDFDRVVREVRNAFFEQARDIADIKVLRDVLVAADVGVGVGEVMQRVENGSAYAALHRDHELARQHGVLGSPTYVFNEGRQLLYGNVGYRIIDANVRELLSSHAVEGEPSWC